MSIRKYCLSGLIVLSFIQVGHAQDLTAREVIKKAMDQMRGNTSQAEMIIRTVRPTWSREMSVRTWMKGEQYSIIQVMSPAKDRGVAFLKRKKEVWNWIPTLERSIKLPPSMMSQSWMGTDFTNDDLVKESSLVEDFTHTFVSDSVVNGNRCYGIELIPKPEAAIVWGKLTVYVDKENFIEQYTRFYDEDGELVNTMTAYDVKMMGGRLIPTRVEMIPADKKNQKTEIIYKTIVFNKPIEDNFFTLEQLRSLK